MKVLLSIKPEFAKKIFLGEKKFEYRKIIFKNEQIKDIVVYVTKPVGRIIGEFKIKQIIKDSPDSIWEQTNEYAGISQLYFNEYFKNKEKAYAIHIESYCLYKEAIDPYKNGSKFIAPQSFKYI